MNNIKLMSRNICLPGIKIPKKWLQIHNHLFPFAFQGLSNNQKMFVRKWLSLYINLQDAANDLIVAEAVNSILIWDTYRLHNYICPVLKLGIL